MGTRWSALFFAPPAIDIVRVQSALQRAVDEVDAQMSTWSSDSDLMRMNAAPVGLSVLVPHHLARVLSLGLAIGRASGGAFDIGQGDAVQAWGFGPDEADVTRIRLAMAAPRRPAHELLEVTGPLVRKLGPITLDLNGIAKGYGVDRLSEALRSHDIAAGLVGIDGELHAFGLRPDGEAWTVAIEAPDPDQRAPHSILSLHDAAIATSGDYRHWVTVGDRRLSHTMDPRRGAPVLSAPASVTVMGPNCAEADAWATALMVIGPDAGQALAAQYGLKALFLMRDAAGGVRTIEMGDI